MDLSSLTFKGVAVSGNEWYVVPVEQVRDGTLIRLPVGDEREVELGSASDLEDVEIVEDQ